MLNMYFVFNVWVLKVFGSGFPIEALVSSKESVTSISEHLFVWEQVKLAGW